jgi:single-strand DNA-binding protein
MLNLAVLMGRLTADPELKTTSTGISVTSFTIAVDRTYQTAGGERQTDFINCVAWRQSAEFITKYFRKGSMIAVQGSIQVRNYVDNNNQKRYVTEVIVDRASFCGSKAETGTGNAERFGAPPPATNQMPSSYQSADASDFETALPADENLPF